MIRSGDLTEQIQIQRRSSTLDASGEQLLVWTTVYTRRAELQKTPGREVFAAAQREGRVPSIFRLRPEGVDVTSADRVVCDGAVYEIDSVVDNGDELQLVCEELA
jgi:SPP1 family predicted phage head-tail adaptor